MKFDLIFGIIMIVLLTAFAVSASPYLKVETNKIEVSF